MYFSALPNELVVHVFESCSTVQNVLALAATSRHFHSVLNASQKLAILASSAEAQYGPIEDAIQLITHNASQPAHVKRKAPLSMSLLSQIIEVGKVASTWADIYPLRRWKRNYVDRRLLTTYENYLIRRAVYRLWLYARAFHNSRYGRLSRKSRQVVMERAKLLHNWSSAEIGEIEDVRLIMRDVVDSDICPSNGTIQRKFRKRFPESDHQLLFNIHLNYPPPATSFQSHFHSMHQTTSSSRFTPPPPAPSASLRNQNLTYLKYLATANHEPGQEGWGDDVPHYYVVNDMMKLDPGQILWLKDNAPMKYMVETFVRGLGEWFDNNGETFGETANMVVMERDDLEMSHGGYIGLQETVDTGDMGVVTWG
ncbi:hypothetical protein MMC25_000884 [Agyrium rufum]|nr:hypothetical protein [Agyrium rufum]